MKTGSEETKKTWEALEKPPFFITLYIDEKNPKRINFLIHGKTSIATLKDMHRMIDEFVLQAIHDATASVKSETYVA